MYTSIISSKVKLKVFAEYLLTVILVSKYCDIKSQNFKTDVLSVSLF